MKQPPVPNRPSPPRRSPRLRRLGVFSAIVGAGALLLGFVARGYAQSSFSTVDTVTKNFVWPQINDKGEKEADIGGSEARVASLTRTEITDMKITLYENKVVTTTITSPFGEYWTADRKLKTNRTVRVVRSDMDMTAQSMEWENITKRATLRENVRVVLTNFDLGANNPSGAPVKPIATPGSVGLVAPKPSTPIGETPPDTTPGPSPTSSAAPSNGEGTSLFGPATIPGASSAAPIDINPSLTPQTLPPPAP